MTFKIDTTAGILENGGAYLELDPASTTGAIISDGVEAEEFRFGLAPTTKITGSSVMNFYVEGTPVASMLKQASAVNYFTISNSATTNALAISAAGTDTNIDVNVVPKGTGVLKSGGTAVSLSGHTHEGTTIDATGVTDGYVLTADGAGNAVWEEAAAGGGGVSWATYGGTITTTPVATGEDSIAIGDGASAQSITNSIVIGKNATVGASSGTSNIVVGYNATAANGAGVGQNIVIGESANAMKGRQNLVIGLNAKTDSNFGSIAIGNYAFTQNNNAIYIGFGNSGYTYKASGDASVALGVNLTVSGTNSIGIGSSNVLNGSYSIGIGRSANCTANFCIAIGDSSQASYQSSISVGQGTYSNGTNAVSIGQNARAHRNGIVIGTFDSSTNLSKEGHIHFSTGGFVSAQPLHEGFVPLWRKTTNATPGRLGTSNIQYGSSTAPTGYYQMDTNSTHMIRGRIMASRANAAATTMFTFEGIATCGSTLSTTAWNITSALTQVYDNSSGLTTGSISIAANTTQGSIDITVTGIAATNIYWKAILEISSMRGLT